MLCRTRLWLLLSAAISVLALSCRLVHTPDPSPATKTHPAIDPAVVSAAAQSTEDDLVDAYAHYGAAVIEEMNEDPELALRDYYESALKDPGNQTLVLGVTRRLLLANQFDKALELLKRATAQPGASGAAYARLGIVYAKLGKPDLALKANREAIKRDPHLLAGYQNLFIDYMQSGHAKQAVALLDIAARLPKSNAEFLIGLAELYANYGLQVAAEKQSSTQRALALLQQAQSLDISDPTLRLKLADGFDLLGKDDSAAPLYQQLLKAAPGDPLWRDNIRSKLANIYLRGHNPKLAEESLEALIQDNPTDVEAYYWLGRLAYEDKKYGQAADAFAKTLLLKPDFKRGYYELIRSQLSGNQLPQALETLGRARDKFGSDFALEYLSALACSQQKDYTNAYAHFTAAEVLAKAKDTNDLTSEFYFEFGAACERKGDNAQAEKCFETCLQLSPDFHEAMNYLGFMWADRGEQLDRARDLISKALKADPKNAAYLDSMGWVLFKLHEPKQALDYVLEAVRLSEEADPILYDHLGDIYAALGLKDKAVEAWNKSLSLEPNEQVKQKVHSAGK